MSTETGRSPTYEELRERLEQLEAAFKVLRRGEADLVVGESGPLVVRLKSLVEERERLAAEMEQLAREWQLTFDSSRDGICILDPSGRVTRANRAVEEIFRCSREEVLGRDFCELAAGNGEQAFSRRDGREGTVPSPGGESLELRRGDRWLTVTVDPVRGAAGQVTGFIAHIHDVTDRKRMELERSALEGQLAQAQKLEAIGRLAGGLAHDFNNLLGVILGCGEHLLDELHPGDPLLEDVRQIVDAARRSATMTRQLLAFSRRQALKPQVVILNDNLRQMEKMLRRLIGEDIQIELSLREDLAPVMVDPGQMDQVILNLVVNARDAMPEGGKLVLQTDNVNLVEADTLARPGIAPGRYVRLAVSDTGCGMEPEVMNRIFEPFFSTKGAERGTGLGLSTVYGIVRQSGGYVRVDSLPGRGTTFEVYLPQSEAEPRAQTPREGGARPGAGEHLLVVEDDPSLRALLNRMLTKLGYRVTLAANGGEAVVLVEEAGLKPDLLMTDVVMPGMSGVVLAKRLKRQCPGLRVVYMSGYAEPSASHPGLLDPEAPFLQKPFTARELSSQLRKLLDS